MDVNQALEKLFSLHNFGIKLGLDNIRNFLNHIGNPQLNLKTVHIAGSNGKGSTSSFIASILQQNGFTVGLYTSPHFVRFNERILINGKMIDDDYVTKFINKHNNFIDEHELTFFEVTTALAFQFFADKKVDYAVIETGLGGRLDATNVLNPLACVITSISLEHTNILGNSIRQIAYEKGEIIKENTKAFVGLLDDEADKVIEEKCEQVKAKLFRLEEYLTEKNDRIDLYTEELEFDDWQIPLKGKHQKYNAALAALVVVKTFDIDDPLVITQGVANVVKNTKLQGRYEFIRQKPAILMDAAHNPDGINSFIKEYLKDKPKFKKSILLFGAMRDKDIRSMVEKLVSVYDQIFITHIDYERAADIDQLKKVFNEMGMNVEICFNKEEFIKEFLTGDPGNCLTITGSMYLLGEIKSIFERI